MSGRRGPRIDIVSASAGSGKTYRLAQILRDAIATAVLVALAFAMDFRMALMACIIFPVAVFPIMRLGRRLRRASRKKLVSTAKLSTLIHE
ncbi:MAG: hypothetical protein ACE5EL_07205, partial [Anaerolineae bacterium]